MFLFLFLFSFDTCVSITSIAESLTASCFSPDYYCGWAYHPNSQISSSCNPDFPINNNGCRLARPVAITQLHPLLLQPIRRASAICSSSKLTKTTRTCSASMRRRSHRMDHRRVSGYGFDFWVAFSFFLSFFCCLGII